MLKKLVRSFTFWFIVIAILEIVAHQMGQDSKSIILIEFNPVLNWISDSGGALYEWMESGCRVACNTITGEISVRWYLGSVVTFAVYGIVLDLVKAFIVQIRRRGRQRGFRK